MKATSMNTVARSIRTRRDSFEGIVSDFQAYWGKLYRSEVTEKLNAYKGATDADSKAKRYALECVLAKMKAMQLSDDEKALIKGMHDEDGFKFENLTEEYILTNLGGSKFVQNGEIMEQRKNRETGEKEWHPIERWTVMKVGRYFRFANIYCQENNK